MIAAVLAGAVFLGVACHGPLIRLAAAAERTAKALQRLAACAEDAARRR